MACTLDDAEILSIMIEQGRCKLNFENEGGPQYHYKEQLNIGHECVIHDSVNCFKIVHPDVNVEDENLDDLYDTAVHNNSEKIIQYFDSEKMDLLFDFERFAENEFEGINL